MRPGAVFGAGILTILCCALGPIGVGAVAGTTIGGVAGISIGCVLGAMVALTVYRQRNRRKGC